MRTITRADLAERVAGQTIASRFATTVRTRAAEVGFRWKRGEELATLTFDEYGQAVARVASALRALGLGAGDRVVLLMANRHEFHIADVAVILAAGTPISLYASSSPEQIEHLVGHSAARIVIVDDLERFARVAIAIDALPVRPLVVLIDDPEGNAPGGTLRWDGLLTASPIDLESAAEAVSPDDLATVIYTSGTTGPPKGVMLDHANLCWTIESLRACLGFPTEGFRLVSYLPMAHIAERMTAHYEGLALGYDVTICPDIRDLGAVIVATRPQLFFGVPRTFERIRAAVTASLATDPERASAFDRAISLGLSATDARAGDGELPPDLDRAHRVAESEILRPVRERIGLDAVECAVTSAAPIPVPILQFFRGLGVPLTEMYGLSEASGPVAWDPTRARPGSVGHAIPGVELAVSAAGEVWCRGGNVFRGYLDDTAGTAEVLDADGWLHTGDVGVLDADGSLRIVDRMKELIVTAAGENVSPANLESRLCAQPLIGQAAVVGDNAPYVVALLVLDGDFAPDWAAGRGLASPSLAELAQNPVVRAEISREVDQVNGHFAHAEQIRRFVLLADEWLADSDELTPTMKLKRRAVEAKYSDEIAALYTG